MRALTLLLLLVAGPAFATVKLPPAPEDLGPAQIDVSDYPPEYQKTYREVFVPFFTKYGGTARMVNSPLVTAEEWRKEIDRIRTRPPCCAACPFLSLNDARALYKFMVYDSGRRKTGSSAEAWTAQRTSLLERFEKEHIGGAP